MSAVIIKKSYLLEALSADTEYVTIILLDNTLALASIEGLFTPKSHKTFTLTEGVGGLMLAQALPELELVDCEPEAIAEPVKPIQKPTAEIVWRKGSYKMAVGEVYKHNGVEYTVEFIHQGATQNQWNGATLRRKDGLQGFSAVKCVTLCPNVGRYWTKVK